MPEAATPTGGAEGNARPAVATATQQTQQQPSQNTRPATVQDRLRASMGLNEPEADEGRTVTQQHRELNGQLGSGKDEVDAPKVSPEGDAQEPDDSTPDAVEGAQETEQTYATIAELAEALGWDVDRLLDLETPTKIDGKEGRAKLRDLQKSYQLEGHLNQKLMTYAEEKKAFEAETSRKAGEIKARVEQLNQVVTLAQKILDGEFADVNWQELQRTDPAGFQAKYGAYSMRLDGIRQLAQVVQQEQGSVAAQQEAAQKAYLSEQSKLLDSKLPEWSDKGKREKDVAEMAAILTDAYGITEQELRSCVDHRQILLAKDAVAWRKLQKSKPATLNKVRAAPKLIRPGTQQSRTTSNDAQLQKERGQLRRTGRTQDAVPLLKKLMYSTN